MFTTYRLFLAVILLTIAACASPVGLGGRSPSCTLDPDDNDLECPVTAALQR